MGFIEPPKKLCAGIIGATIGGVFAFRCINHLQLWGKPDLRYEEGSYCHVGTVSGASLKLENFCGSDVDAIRKRAKFPEPLAQPPDTSNVSHRLFPLPAFAKGDESTAREIDRLVPGQSLYVCFSVQGAPELATDQRVGSVAEISCKGGKAKTGRPASWTPTIATVFIAASVGPLVLVIQNQTNELRKYRAGLSAALSQMKHNNSQIEAANRAIDEIIEAQARERLGDSERVQPPQG